MSDTLRINNLFTTAIAYSTLTGSTIITNSLALSTLTVSSINSGAPGVAAYSTLNVSSLNTSSITASSIITAPGYNSNIGNILYTSLADSGQTAANFTTASMPATAPAGSVISGTYRATAGASSGAIGMWLGSYAYTAGTTYNFTFTGMQGSQSLALYVYQYNSAGTDKVQISSNAYSITTSAATVSGSFTANLYPATYTGSIVFFFQALAVNQYVNFTAFSMNTGAMNVGIGTTNPSNILDVRPVGTGDAPNYGISHYFPATYSATVYANELVASLRFKWYNDLWDISGIRGGSTSWQSLAIRYNGTEFITVGAGGNVGIGVTGPSYTLDVAGYARATSGLLAGNGTGAVSLQLFDLPAASWQITTGGYNLSINNNSAGWTNRVTINQSGQVGIGLTNPSQKLEVNGTVRATGYNLSGYTMLIPKVVYVGSQVLNGVFSGTTTASGTASFPVFIGAYGESIIEGAFRSGSNPDTTQYFKAYYITAQITNGNDCQIGVAINNIVLANGITYSSPSFMVIIQSGYFLKWTQFPTQGAYGYQGTGLNLQVYQSNTSVTNFQVNYITVHCVYLHTSYTSYPTVSGLTYNSSYQQFN